MQEPVTFITTKKTENKTTVLDTTALPSNGLQPWLHCTKTKGSSECCSWPMWRNDSKNTYYKRIAVMAGTIHKAANRDRTVLRYCYCWFSFSSVFTRSFIYPVIGIRNKFGKKRQ